ncbi:MAG: 16S rRNA (adenine(1518)-N(6)/adenine(1519)-N(6))-dimethyltransferase RsmA, partial [Bdellovibrionota bacterium]
MEQRQQIMRRLQEMEVAPKRSLGQNFLVSEHVIENIISQVRSFKPKAIVEIGPGLGSLTEKLLAMAVPIHLIELDREYARYWKQRETAAQGANIGSSVAGGVQVSEADALHIDWNEIVKNPATLLVSNLPYQIGARVVIDRSLGPDSVTKMILMFQKEVAQRLMATPSTKDYGFLTVVAQAQWKIRLLLEAKPNDFYPAPKVTSRVLIFERLKPMVDEFFVEFVKKA